MKSSTEIFTAELPSLQQRPVYAISTGRLGFKTGVPVEVVSPQKRLEVPPIVEMSCLICGGYDFETVFSDTVNDHIVGRCTQCGMVQASPVGKKPVADYSNYGDYLLIEDRAIQRRISWASQVMQPWFRVLKQRFGKPTVLDFGSGASFLCQAAESNGLNMYGVEPSDKLIDYSKRVIGFKKVYKNIEDIEHQFDGVFMMDVIEHLDPKDSRTIMRKLLDRLNPGGLLIGNTPNICSANIRLCKTKDPVIAPPSHLCYFSPDTLDAYLRSLGLRREKLYSRGLSSNSFFRKSKFERSFIETGFRSTPLHLLPIWASVRTSFAAAGYLLQPFGLGYQIYFVYNKVGT